MFSSTLNQPETAAVQWSLTFVSLPLTSLLQVPMNHHGRERLTFCLTWDSCLLPNDVAFPFSLFISFNFIFIFIFNMFSYLILLSIFFFMILCRYSVSVCLQQKCTVFSPQDFDLIMTLENCIEVQCSTGCGEKSSWLLVNLGVKTIK